MNRSTTWEAANVSQRSKKSSSTVSPRRRDRTETDRATLEATLNRLSKAYNTAMECIGALHRADKDPSETSDKLSIIQNVSRAARKTLEEGILVDPLVGPQVASVWTAGVQQQQQQQQENSNFFTGEARTLPCSTWIRRLVTPEAKARPALTSQAHERTVQQIAYLALVNYADLLMCACACPVDAATVAAGRTTTTTTAIEEGKTSLLDRGIVKKLKAWSQPDGEQNLRRGGCCCCWNDNDQEDEDACSKETNTIVQTTISKIPNEQETVEQTLQLVVWALMDATTLDGSDPLIWLKLACACRRLGRVQGGDKYRILERHALEQGIACRPAIPNRLVVQALEEWQRELEDQLEKPCQVLAPPVPFIVQHLELPRYSWAVLGRILLRACRGDTSVSAMQPREMLQFSSVSLGLSPLLALPSDTILQLVISYLDPRSYSKLKQVCRTFSVLRYTATTPKHVTNTTSLPSNPSFPAAPNETSTTDPTVPIQAPPPPPQPQPLTSRTSKSVSASSKESVQGSRVSKRLRSQIITSGKRAERSQRRSSVEYCVYAIVLGTAPPSQQSEKDDEEKNRLSNNSQDHDDEKISTSASSFAFANNLASTKLRTVSEKEHKSLEAMERIGPGSLSSFVRNFEDGSVPPLCALFRYVAHVSIHVEQVFSSDQHGAIVLLASVTDSLDVMLKQTRSYQGLIPSWSTGDYRVPAGTSLQADEIFAIDLLHAELRFKRCDREDQHATEIDFDSDANIVEQLVPVLGTLIEQTPNTVIPTHQWNAIRVRYQWLTAGYYLWRSRISHDVAESREAEQEGLSSIKDTIAFMDETGMVSVATPHLEGIGRSGEIWKRLSVGSLTIFQNKVLASSVVLKAQEQFIDAVANLSDSEGILSDTEMSRFVGIASYLLERYSSEVDSPESNYVELLEDFIGVHGTSMFSFSLEDEAVALRKWFAGVVPTHSITRDVLQNMAEPCILSILLSCMQLERGKEYQSLRLILRLIRTLQRYQQQFVMSFQGAQNDLDQQPEADAMSDDLSLMSDDEKNDTGSLSSLAGYALVLGLLIETLGALFELSDDETKVAFAASEELARGIKEIFIFCSTQPILTGRASYGEDSETPGTLFVLERVTALLGAIAGSGVHENFSSKTDQLHLGGLVKVFMSREASIKSLINAPFHQKTRSAWKVQALALSKEIGYVCLFLGSILSNNLACMQDRILVSSSLLTAAAVPIKQFSAALLSLFQISHSRVRETIVFENLRTPIATALIGFCGAAASTSIRTLSSVSLVDFVDTDESATDWMEEEDEQEQASLGHILRVIYQIVHVVQLTIGIYEDRYLSKYSFFKDYVSEHGPLLPLISCRVLSYYSDIVLVEFRNRDSGLGLKSSIWLEYPVGTRKIGSILDSLLHKVYRHLYGFNLSSSADTKETGVISAIHDSDTPSFLPEGVKAAAQLYRCVMRASGFGRKSTPKIALDAIRAALPEMRENPRAEKAKKFIFKTGSIPFNCKAVVSIVEKTSTWENLFDGLTECFYNSGVLESSSEDEATLVRQGIAHVVAQGPLPNYQEIPDMDVRAETAAVEMELSRKFDSILFELTHGNIASAKNWVKAAQCCWSKSEMIADRLGKQSSFVRCRNFALKGPVSSTAEGEKLSELIARQERDDNLRLAGWTEILGQDLSVYMRHSWSSFESLQDCSRALEAQFKSRESLEDLSESIQAYEEITKLHLIGRFDLWQLSWGGLFVSGLRCLAMKCMATALFVLNRGLDQTIETQDDHVAAEICESLGIFMYSEVSGSQTYGYPMRKLTQRRRRDYAQAALTCFSEALAVHRRASSPANATNVADWDILFMIGKCQEKIASTFVDEKFSTKDPANEGEHQFIRRYEYHMKAALSSYAASLEHGLKLEKEGVLVVEQQGGSGHGATEVQYRLHATRLKCLIAALMRSSVEREYAELEALRLVERHWHGKSPPDETLDIRERAWNVLTDVVDTMMQCRSEYSCFHRSVYRHAQALLWAPVICDPSQVEGCFGSVPGSRAFKLRGLNSGSAVESAASVIGSLFDRRRAQLCGVWVTQGSTQSFEQLNVSVRKYDSLRGKYIAAYLETLDLCHRKNDLETFWRWVAACNRDMPSFFHATAGQPKETVTQKRKVHTNDSLIVGSRSTASFHFLADVKRRTNTALASVLLNEVNNLKNTAKVTDVHLKQAYSCFLRLNCDPSELHKNRVRKSSSVKPIVELLITVYQKFVPREEQERKQHTTSGDWGMESLQTRLTDSCLEKCRELFPSLSGNFLSSKKTAPKKKRAAPNESEATEQVFRVSVPEGLTAGDTFLTEIMVGGTKKRLRLTVPKGGATTLRFSLNVSKEDGPPTKKSKVDEQGDSS